MLQTINLMRKLRIPPCRNLVWFSNEPSNKLSPSLDFHSSYNKDQIDRILSTVNSRSETELVSFNISKQRVRKIELRKQKQGAFKSIEDILELDGFGIKVLEKFCDSILDSAVSSKGKPDNASKLEEEEDSTVSIKKQSFVSPALLENTRKTINSCVAFHVDLNFIAWAKLSLDGNFTDAARSISVEDWMCYEISNEDKKPTLSDLINVLLQMDAKIPSADAYIIEAPQVPQASRQPGSPVQMSINVQKAQFLAMLSVLMASRIPPKRALNQSQSDDYESDEMKKIEQPSTPVYFLRNFLSARLYRTYIGNERVSSETVVENILRYNLSKDQPFNVTFEAMDMPINLRNYYSQCDRTDRDYMGQSLLNGLAFMKLCILKCPKSTAALNKRVKS